VAAAVTPGSSSSSAVFRCLACGAGAARVYRTGCRDYYLSTPFVVDYHRCSDCGLVQQFPAPADVGPFYRDYPIHEANSALHDLARRVVMAPVYYDAHALPGDSVLLDYGCGNGAYLRDQAGRGLARLGFESDAALATRLSVRLGLTVYSDRHRMLQERTGQVDAVTLHFVLEHVLDLHGTFADAHELLRPGGLLYVVVPEIGSFEARLFGARWHGLDPPRHISFPDEAAVTRLAQRHGFSVAERRPVPFPNGFAASLPVLLTGRFRFLLFAAFLPLGLAFAHAFPTGATAYLLTRR
jgi:SAM-dependent methyltransferase